MQLRTGFVLSALEYDLVWTELDLGQMCYPLDVPSHGLTMEERARLRADNRRPMHDSGVLIDGEVDPELATMFRILANPTKTVDLVGFSRGPLRAVAALGYDGAVLATLDDHGLAVRPIRDTALVSSIVGALPDMPAGEGQSMSVPLDAMRNASAVPGEEDFGDDPFGAEAELTEADLLIKSGVPRSDALALAELAEGRIGGGQFGVSVAGRRGGRMRRAESMVTWFDTRRGRYLMFSDGAWVSLAPAGADRIAWRIEESFRNLAD
jgi:ESX secretion-associated protein EspG